MLIRIVILAALLVATNAGSAFAQRAPAPQGKWEIEVHAGRIVVVNPLDGTQAGEAAGEEFRTVTGGLSLVVPTWTFGFGNALWRQVQTQLQSPPDASIASLDSVVSGSSARPRSGFGIGVRVSRQIGSRVRLEGTIDLGGGHVRVSEEALAAIEATRASYLTAWQRLFASAPSTFQNASVTSEATITQGSGGQLMAIGSVSVDLKNIRRYVPYLMVGGGVLRTLGEPPSVSLVSRYTTRLGGAALIDQTDDVRVRYALDKHLLVTSFGVGVRRMVSDRWGWRAEIREHLSGNRMRQILDATPSAAAGANPSAEPVFATNAFIGIQLANPSNSTARSSLGGPGPSGVQSFTGTGMESRFAATIGAFLRF